MQAAVAQALDLVEDGFRVGLGSGRAASAFIVQLGARCRDGLRLIGVATSQASADLARRVGLPVRDLAAEPRLDITIDGADEVAPNLDLIKGWGGALVRERIVAAASARQVIIVGAEKLVRQLGERGRLPIEIIPFGRPTVMRQVEALGLSSTVRAGGGGGGPFITDSGNIILDCALPKPIGDHTAAARLEQAVLALAGVVDTGLFLGTADQVLVGHPDGRVESLRRTT